jgi:Flp pilus assembly protein TadG
MNRLNTLHARFCRHQDGTITIVFGLILFVVLVLVGFGVDGSRVMVSRTRTTEALDAATLAATRALMAGQLTDHEVDLLAIDYFNKSVDSNAAIGTSYNHFHVSIDHTSKTVKITVNAQLPTTFGRFANVESIDYRSVSEATYNVNDIELGLVLDTTGSIPCCPTTAPRATCASASPRSRPP